MSALDRIFRRRKTPGKLNRLSAATMLLDFTTGNPTLDPRITFTRGSNATLVDRTGEITYAPHNLLKYSEQFDNAAWIRVNSTVAANTIAAPDGSLTADKLVEDTANSAHNIRMDGTSVTQGFVYTFSIYAKAGGRSTIGITFSGTNFGSNGGRFDLEAGTAVSFSGSPTLSIEPVGNGWFRCIYALTALATASSNFTPQVFMYSGVAPVYTGDGTSGIYIWGAQLNVGALQPYYPTTVKNLLGYTQEFDNAAWAKNAVNVTANTVIAPDGSLTADLLQNNSTDATHYTNQAITGLIDNTTYTYSVSVKGATAGYAFVRFRDKANTFFNMMVNLSNGSIVSKSSGLVCGVISQGGGWYRCYITCSVGTGANNPTVWLYSSVDGVEIGTTENVGIYVWGAQLSDSASLDPYVCNPGSAPTAAAYYGPRFDYDPVTLAPKGLLIEEQRTNLLTYSEQFDNGAWTKTRCSVTANSITSPDGTLDADKLVEDTTASSTHDLTVSQSFTSGVTYTFSFYAKGSERNVRLYFPLSIFGTSYSTVFNLENGTASAAVTGSVFEIKPVGNDWYRCSMTQTATATGNSGFTVRLVQGASTISYTGDGYSGIFIWGAQLEAGAFPTSYIPTTTAAATRAADVAVMTGTNFSSWYNQSEGTLFVEASRYSTSAYSQIWQVSDDTNSNRIRAVGWNDGTERIGSTDVGGVAQANGYVAAGSASLSKYAVGYKIDDIAWIRSGSSVINDKSALIPTVNRMDIGSQLGTSFFLNGHISRIAYYPRRLSNTELQSITS